jgi:hypothetical protein
VFFYFASLIHTAFNLVRSLEKRTIVMSLSRASGTLSRTSGPRYPLYKSQAVVWARWAEDGLYYKARITDLVPETQSYLVEFVDYGNKQICTSADLMPLDAATMLNAAPPPLPVDPIEVETQRVQRIAARQAEVQNKEILSRFQRYSLLCLANI